MTLPFLDLLGRPINVGDQVLVKGYGSMSLNLVAEVLAVNKKSISVNVKERQCIQQPKWEYVNGNYINSIPGEYQYVDKRMTRYPSECLVVNELLPASQAARIEFQQELINTPASDLVPDNLSETAFNAYSQRIGSCFDERTYWSGQNYTVSDHIQDRKAEVESALKSKYPEYVI